MAKRSKFIQALSGGMAMPTEISAEVEILASLNQGLPFEVLAALESRGIVDHGELLTFIAARTLARRKSENRLSPEESDLVARLLRGFEFAVQVFGNEDKAKKWLRTESSVLNGQRPLDLLRSDYGARIVEAILGRIDHGIYT